MATLAIVNPRKRRKARKARRRRAAPAIQHKRRRRKARRAIVLRARRNPRRRGRGSMNFKGILGQTQALATSGAYAAVGALALDVIWSYLPIPEVMKSGYTRHIAKGAGAVALGIVARNFVSKDLADKLAFGAMTVALYGLFKDAITQFAPAVRLSGWADGDSAWGLGYSNTAQVVSEYGVGEYGVGAIPDFYDPNAAMTQGVSVGDSTY